jgi:hypothetical protein
MKIDELARPGLIVLGAVGIAATTLLGFAAGVVAARDPQALRRTVRRVALEAARSLERATLMAAQVREQAGDLWAEVREEALGEVDAADFERAAASAPKTSRTTAGAAAAAAGTASAPQAKASRKRVGRPRKPRTSGEAAPEATAGGATSQG